MGYEHGKRVLDHSMNLLDETKKPESRFKSLLRKITGD
jgi:hypothetical protein